MENQYNLTWFLATIYGKPFDGIEEPLYEAAFIQAEFILNEVACHCPKIYPTALSIQIALILTEMKPDEDGDVLISSSNSTGKVAFVKKDKVYDIEREYVLTDQNELTKRSTPAGILKTIMDRCKTPLQIGASVISGFGGLDGCGCADDELYSRFVEHADKAEPFV